jgi:3-keto-5-aminohexanoate cleavage enzyme
MRSYQPDRKMIITVAVNGSLPTKADTPHVPVTPAEVIEDTVQCWEAGASIVHIHARDRDQRPSHDYEFFRACLEGLRARCDIIVQFSTGSRGNVDRETRVRSVDLRPDMMSLNAGSCNFSHGPYVNSLQDIEFWLGEMKRYGVKPEIECFDLSHLYAGIDMQQKGLIEKPLQFTIILGVHGALPFTPQNFMHVYNCIPDDAYFNVIGVGRHQLTMTALAAALGGNCRVGLEDNVYYSYKVLATNRQLVERAVRIARECQREIATPAEARKILNIK